MLGWLLAEYGLVLCMFLVGYLPAYRFVVDWLPSGYWLVVGVLLVCYLCVVGLFLICD